MILAAIVVPWLGGLALIFLDGRKRAVAWAACGVLLASLALTVRLAIRVAAEGSQSVAIGGWPAGVGITLRADALGVAFAVLSLAVLAAAVLYRLAGGYATRRFPGLVLFMATGLTGIFLTGDAFNFYVFFELAMTTAFAVAAEAEEPREIRATLLFVMLNVFGSALFLMAIGGLYHVTGTLDMDGIAAALAGSEAPRASGVGALLLAAFGLKLGLFPFHTWLPDVYRDLRPEVAAIFAGALANIGSYGVLRFGAGMMPGTLADSGVVIGALGAASVLYGGVAAVGARTATGVLAYSSIGQAGYTLMAVALATPAGYAAATIYALVTAAGKTLLFLAAGIRGPLVGAAFAAGAFSVAGLPPFAGFTAKLSFFHSGVQADAWAMVTVAVLGSGLSLLYLFPALQREYWRGDPPSSSAPVAARALLVVLALAIAAGGAWPAPLLRLGEAAAAGLGAVE